MGLDDLKFASVYFHNQPVAERLKIKLEEKAMNTKRIAGTVGIFMAFILVQVILAACNTDHGMMHGDSVTGMNDGSWTQILTIFGVVCLVGLLLWFTISRRRR